MKQIVTLLCLLVACTLTATARADQFVGTGSRWPVAQTKAIASHPDLDYVFVGDGDTLNVFNKTTLALEAHLRLTGTSEGIRALVYFNDTLYAACGYSGIQIIDVENPLAPVEATGIVTIDSPTSGSKINAYDLCLFNIKIRNTNGFETTNNYLLTVDKDHGLRMMNIDVRLVPIQEGFINLKTGFTYSYSPLRAGVYDTDNPAYDSTPPDQAAFSKTNVAAIVMMDTSSGPVIGRIIISGFGSGQIDFTMNTATGLPTLMGSVAMLVDDVYAYCIDSYTNDLITYDVSSQDQSPSLVFSQSTNSDYDPNGGNDKQTLALYYPRSVNKRDDYLFIATHGFYDGDPGTETNYFGLNVINVSDPAAPRAISRYPLTGANSVMVENDSAYIMSIHEGLYKVDLAVDPDADPEVTITDPPGLAPSASMLNAHDLWVQQDLGIVYISDNIPGPDGGLTLLRLKPQTADEEGETVITRYASPAMPIHERFISTPGTAMAACINEWNTYAYVADGDEGIQVFEISSVDGPADPIRVAGSNIPITTGEVIDVEPMGTWLLAATTAPDEDVWVVDVSAPTDIDNPATYTPQPINLSLGAETAHGVTAYTRGNALYAMVPGGTAGLFIVHLNPDDEHPDQLEIPPQAENIHHIAGTDVQSVFAKASHSGDYAALADGAGGVTLIRLFQDDAPLELDPITVASIDTSAYGNAIDVSMFKDSTSTHLYVLTDNPDRAILLYQVTDMEHPEFMGYAASYGRGSSILATEIIVPSATSLTGQANIRGVVVADGPGGIAFRQVTDDDSSISDRTWPDDSSSFCFVSQALSSTTTGIMLAMAALWGAVACLFHWFSRRKDRTSRH